MEPEQRIAATIARVWRLLEKGEIDTSAAGYLYISLGVAVHLDAHPDCDMNDGYGEDDPQEWMDFTGNVWGLTKTYRDIRGNLWRFAGGFQADPDTQPIMCRVDRPGEEATLTRVRAASGGDLAVTR
jgi:hypothetical protein